MNARERFDRVRARRRTDRLGGEGDDPAAGLVNLFDLWMVFAVAVLLTAVGAGSASTVAGDAVDDATRSIDARLRAAEDELSGHGERLGVAYRLTSGEIVYVPEDDGESGAAAR